MPESNKPPRELHHHHKIVFVAEDLGDLSPLADLAARLAEFSARLACILVNAKGRSGGGGGAHGMDDEVGVVEVNRREDVVEALRRVVRADEKPVVTAFGDDDFQQALRGMAPALHCPVLPCGKSFGLEAYIPLLADGLRGWSVEPLLVVGVAMKHQRHIDLAKRGILALDPYDGLLFLPLECGIPICEMDAILHKSSDFLEKEESEAGFLRGVLSYKMENLKNTLEATPHVCVIDPFPLVSQVMDRSTFSSLMSDMEATGKRANVVPRISVAPFFMADSFCDPHGIEEKMSARGMRFPLIVKPCTACGVKGSHRHALVFNRYCLETLNGVGLPACLQTYVNHGALQHKIYVVGKNVYCRSEPSIPDLDPGQSPSRTALLFDTLESLHQLINQERSESGSPKSQPGEAKQQCFMGRLGDYVEGTFNQLDLHAVMIMAAYLKGNLKLTIFGFDVIVDVVTGDHFVIDVNFLPSCKNIPGIEEVLRRVIYDRIVEWSCKKGRILKQ